jgi:Secretion system C-terminal sorting domain
MKKLLFILFFWGSATFVFADAGIYNSYMSFSLNGGGEFYRGFNSGNPAFGGSSLATDLNPNANTLVMKLRGFNTFENNGSMVMSGTISYRVYIAGGTVPPYTTVSLTNTGTGADGTPSNRYFNNNSPDINLLASVSAAGTYNVEIQFDAVTNGVNCANPLSANARQLGSIATFTTNVVLANELTSFNASKQNNQVNLSWLTATEKANESFSIERSKDGKNFSAIGQMKGAINSTVSKEYAFTDATPLKGINYYRLKSTEIGGKTSYSNVVSVSLMDKNNKTFVYPNPVAQTALRMEHEAIADGDLSIRIMDITGRVVQSEKRAVSNGSNIISLEVNNLASGQYIIAVDEQLIRFVKN